jgi:hypothetical protein
MAVLLAKEGASLAERQSGEDQALRWTVSRKNRQEWIRNPLRLRVKDGRVRKFLPLAALFHLQ